MIIVKDKAKNSKIYIQRSAVNLSESNINNGGNSGEDCGGGNGNIIELTQAEYDALVARGETDENTLYMITDATVNPSFITGAQMVEYVDDMVGDINKILEDIIG